MTQNNSQYLENLSWLCIDKKLSEELIDSIISKALPRKMNGIFEIIMN